MIYLGKKLFISRFAWWNELLFLNEHYCQGLKAAVVGLGESTYALPQVQEPAQRLPKPVPLWYQRRLMSPEPLTEAAEDMYLPLL